MIAQGEVWWADLGEPAGCAPGSAPGNVLLDAKLTGALSARKLVLVLLGIDIVLDH